MNFKFRYITLIFIFIGVFCGLAFGSLQADFEEVQKERRQRKNLVISAYNIARKHEVSLLLHGTGEMIDCPDCRISFAFVDKRLMTIDQARPMVVSMIGDLLERFQHPFYEGWLKILYFVFQYPFGFKIAFWDQNVQRPLRPYLAQVSFVGNRIIYYYANPIDQSLEIAISEDYKCERN